MGQKLVAGFQAMSRFEVTASLPLALVRHVRRGAETLWRHHRLMVVAVGLSLVPRALAAMAFRPAVFTPDSFYYLANAVHLSPGITNPSGYPIFLRMLEPLHSLLLITSAQHLMGIATAIVAYAVLRHWGLPPWGAVLAVSPTLFDSRQVALESAILPDTLYGLLLMLSVGLVLTRRGPKPWRCALAGLLLAWAAVTRGNGAPEMAGLLAALAVRRVGWRSLTAALTAFAIPMLTYMATFDFVNGNFAITNSDGMFLWSRTMSFADCAVVKPPPNLRPLCPSSQPGHPGEPTPAWSARALLTARSPGEYLWAHGAWWRNDSHPGINAANNSLAMHFAVDAIAAQPGAYLRTVVSGVTLTFVSTDRSETGRAMRFTALPDVRRLSPIQQRRLNAYARTTSDTYQIQPYAYFLYLYQEPVYFPGVIFLAVIAAGLVGAFRRRPERGWPCALPWVLAAVGVVAPVALHEARYRYVITVVPLACLAAGLAFSRPGTPGDFADDVADATNTWAHGQPGNAEGEPHAITPPS